MSSSPKSGSQTASRARPKRRHPAPRLKPMMACDTGFQTIARRYLMDLTTYHDAACRGDPEAVHQMRVALTHLRTAILFFSPMVAGPHAITIRNELKWLNAQLGAVRDLDVAIRRLKAISREQPQAASYRRLGNTARAANHHRLLRTLRSVRYRRLVKRTSDWIENGPWSIKTGKPAAKQRASPIAAYSAGKSGSKSF